MTFIAKNTDFSVPEKTGGYTEREVLRLVGSVAIKNIRDYRLSNYSGLIYSTAEKVIHTSFGKETETKTAEEVENLLRKADREVQEACINLIKEEATV